jgi:hypothetical protein
MWYIYTLEYYSAIKKTGIMSLSGKWMKLEITLCEISRIHKDECVSSHVQNADLKKDVNIGLSGGCWDQWEENERR